MRNLKYKEIFLFFFFAVFICQNAEAQLTKVRGKVIDSKTKLPLPFVNITFKGTTIGTITDFKGNYFIETRYPSDVLQVSYIGYKTKDFKVNKKVFQTINIELETENINLQEIVVKPGENPSHKILRKIIKNKHENNPDKIETYQYEVYNKMEIDINNIDDDFKKQKVFKHFQFVFDYVDTSVVTGKSYLPAFITETLSDYYYQKSPKKEKEIIKANKISGVENESISKYTGQMYLDVNIYDNYINIFGKGFVSPIAKFGLMYYKYYLVDSSFIDNKWCYQISFKPKRKQEPTFTGDFWVNDTTFAIKKAKIRIAEDANINFVNDFVANLEYSRINNKTWFLTKQKLFVDFNLSDKSTGFFGRKTTTYRNIVIDKPMSNSFFSKSATQETTTLDGALEKSDEYWQKVRHEKLSKKESSIYNMIDSVKEVPVFKTFVDFVTTLVTGYYVKDYFKYGPYYSFYSFNSIEGNRIRLGGRTSLKFSKRLLLSGHVAYGDKDKRFKYALGFLYMVSKKPRISIGGSYKHDIEQLGRDKRAFFQDNILASVLTREYNNKLTMVNETKCFFEKVWYQGFSNKLIFNHRTIFSTQYVPFMHINDGIDTVNYNSLISSEITLNTRFAYNEKYVSGNFLRTNLGTKYPILNLDLTTGLKNVFHSNFEYYKVNFSIKHKFNINPFGKFKYVVDAGKYFGKTPYAFLQLHEGNETYALNNCAFNMMNYYEFVSDEYASLFAEHHFEGFFFNHIPLLRRLKWREVVEGKALIGRLNEKNRDVIVFPKTLTGLSKPYFEAGLGVENILHIIRIDAMWRLSYLDNPNIPKFGIRAKLQIKF